MLNLVLYQPDIAQNFGATLRLSACMGAVIHVIEPCGFPFDAARLRRAGMDYIHNARYVRHVNWQAFLDYRQRMDERRVGSHEEPPSRLLLLETDGTTNYAAFDYRPTDYIVIGSEGAGTPRDLYAQMDATLTIPMREGMRSLNMAMSAGMLVAEACRQLNWQWQSAAACTSTGA